VPGRWLACHAAEAVNSWSQVRHDYTQ